MKKYSFLSYIKEKYFKFQIIFILLQIIKIKNLHIQNYFIIKLVN